MPGEELANDPERASDAPTRIAHYRVGPALGRGGNGVVYLATDDTTGRGVALKLLLPELVADEDRRRRLLREARAASRIEHPNVARLLEAGEDGGSIYLAMELVEGATLREALARGPIARDAALRIGRQIAGAVAAAHAGFIIHRDLKPENVMLAAGQVVKVLDFGLAKFVDPRPSSSDETISQLTEEGRIVGTPGYMSPEQIAGKPLDQRTDVFSFGVILYELLAGRRPFTGESGVEVMIAVHRDAPPPLGIDPALEQVVSRCLAKRPEDRYASAVEVCEALDRVAELPARSARGRIALVAAALAVPIGAVAAYTLTREGAVGASADQSCAAFQDHERWASFSPSTQGGYLFNGGAFDGTYLYLAPAGTRGVTRYDTRSDFGAASSWTRSDVVSGPLTTGAAIDDRVYFAGKVPARYDPREPFDAPAAWQTFDLGTRIPQLESTWLGGHDGRHLYFVPTKGGSVARVDTTRAFTDGDAWEVFDINSLVPGGVCTDCASGVFDGRYLYVVPQYEPGTIVARYDTRRPFAEAASWQTFDLAGVDPRVTSFAGAAFDGRYVYLAPYANAVIRATGVTLRFDTTRELTDEAAWSAFATTEVAPLAGYQGIGSDGRYLYYVPYYSWYEAGSGYASTALRYDTAGAFDTRASWCSFDLAAVSPAARGYTGAVFDGESMYFTPFDTGAPVIRHTVAR